jgi:hypothetical protein
MGGAQRNPSTDDQKRHTETDTSGNTMAGSTRGMAMVRDDDGLRCAPPILRKLQTGFITHLIEEPKCRKVIVIKQSFRMH